jgi:hypothetical protein
MDIKNNLRYKVLVERKDFAFFVELEYENLPAFCVKCSLIGHDTSNCKRFPSKELVVDGNARKMPMKKVFIAAKNKNAEVIEASVVMEKNKQSVVMVETTIEEPLIVENAASTSIADKLPMMVEPILQPILQPIHESPSKDADKVCPILDVESSDDSDFSDAQMVMETQLQIPPDIVQKDIYFLKESWANMADVEDGNVEDQHRVEAPFQTVLTKSQKKAMKKREAAGKSSPYSTRARGGKPQDAS